MAEAKLITRRQIARDVPKRWRATYCYRNGWPNAKLKAISEHLDALVDPTPEQVDDAIGNDSWTSLCCDACERRVEAVVRVGAEEEIDAPSATLCELCVRAALAAFTDENTLDQSKIGVPT